SNRSLTITPLPDQFGSGTVSVILSDSDGGSVTNVFSLTVNAVNDSPTLNPISDQVVDEDSGEHVLNLSGISSGASNEIQTLQVTAQSSNPGLIPAPQIT